MGSANIPPNPPNTDYNPGMIAMANASQMSTLFQSNASTRNAGIASATQMYQANMMYLVQSDKIDADLTVAKERIAYQRERTELKHEEAMADIDNDKLELELEAKAENLGSTYNYNPYTV